MCGTDLVAQYIPRLLSPMLLLFIAVYHFIIIVLQTAVTRPWKLINIHYLRTKSFSRLWKENGAQMSQEMPAGTDSLLASVSGLVLDLGPGTGEILSRLNPSQILAVYGAEPAVDMHSKLRENVKKHGFDGKYTPMLCGAEPESLIPALAKCGMVTGDAAGEGVFDEICCIRVLCGIPRPRDTIQALYGLLKPGGRMIVCEHVVVPWRTEGSKMARFMQFVYTMIGWPFFMAGCELQRHTELWLREAAGREGWASVNLKYVEPKTAVPFIVGELRKRG
ncbi:S-adenosyl-L-methionine-dependent methyltransferase [Delitschia confertaspora ATCC 74209]|uniref:S-adenosyl-L-methionine-dependent methyltransferase n=1 Tax=Delitschia confertaspora ATCC 74209 TaxID=1513339 RepID=A0A9P4MQ58_9PLEO|nr:S-adenosyl-L-methionine-dependent methyltransferase [Delitschia confertaspora ATCC 74209]